ncbi:MAG: hypothetical protein CK544_05660 [Planctomycetaceae bacterium]|nr:MAG: hypothetical protein CK544_05660 [Planctomycetaceae bacterium]
MTCCVPLCILLGNSPALVLLDAIVECGGACGGTRDLADALVSLAANAASDPVALERLCKSAQDPEDVAHFAGYRTIAAMAIERSPAGVRDIAE